MSLLFNSLEAEVTKYKDINNILNKLQEDGEVQNIFDAFKDIFDNEHNFTMRELSRIEDEKKQNMNIQEQCENNLSLFKSNFQLIVSMILEKAFKATFSESKSKSIQNFESTRAETMDNLTLTQIPETPKKKTKKAKTKRGASPRAGVLDLSLVTKTPKSTKNKKHSISQISTSQTQSPLAKIFGNTSNIIAKDKSPFNQSSISHSNQSHALTPKRQSRALNHTMTSLGAQSNNSFVQSEFNYIVGPVTFSKSPKREDSPHFSPGPAAYKNEPSSFRAEPSATIGKSQKISWIDEHVSRIDSPGAGGRHYSHHFLSK